MTNIIKISREFSNSQLGNLWLGRERDVAENEDPIEAFLKANEELENAYQRLGGYIPSTYEKDGVYYTSSSNGLTVRVSDIPPKEIPTIQVSKTDKQIQSIKEEILECGDLASLKTYEKIAKTENELSVAYSQMYLKLYNEGL